MSGRLAAGGGPAVLGVDVGGTFTDAVLVAGGRIFTSKKPSTEPQSVGVLAAAEAVLASAAVSAPEVARFVHGMTVATNALLERRGARVVLVATEGFKDVLTIGRQDRAELYTLYPRRSEPLVPRDLCLGVRERVGPEGVRVPLTEEEVLRVRDQVIALEPEAVAVGLLWSFFVPDHELRLREALEVRLGGVPVLASVEVAPVFREVERIGTTVVDAYVTPCTGRYLRSLAAACDEAGLRHPEIMESSGGTAPLAQAAGHAARLLLSGPAGGVMAAGLAAGRLGFDRVLSFDMGGTSTDCAAFGGALVSDTGSGRLLETSTERTIAGQTVRLPAVDIHTVSAGGGSIAWVDAGGALKVGPRSAGARPGPVCYGLGGREPTVTDANVVLGRIAPLALLGGTLRLDQELAHLALARLGEQAGLSPREAAEGVLRVAVFNMAAAVRKVTLQRGLDPRTHVLVVFGGAGGLHACALAGDVGMDTVVLPVRAGVLSALGLVAAPPRADRAATVMWLAEGVDRDEWQRIWSRLEQEARSALGASAGEAARAAAEGPAAEIAVRREIEARYRGQSHELGVILEGEDPTQVERLFHHAHRERYGYSDPEAAVELVTLRAVAVRPPIVAVPPEFPPAMLSAGTADVVVGGRVASCAVFRVVARAAESSATDGVTGPLCGPVLLAADEFSAFVEPGWQAVAVPGAVLMTKRPPGTEADRG